MTDPVVHNPWRSLRQFTGARIGIGRAGVSTPTSELLQFQLAHAQARDAVYAPINIELLSQELTALSQQHEILKDTKPIPLHSQAADRNVYLQRPDLGRLLNDASLATLAQRAEQSGTAYDLAIVIADGLSATAITKNAAAFLNAFALALSLDATPWRLAPITLVEQGRVAIGDDIGEQLNAQAVLVMIGERPGLSSPDSMGLYLTWQPKRGLKDNRRNCISNVRPEGLSYENAAHKTLYLLREARKLKQSGVAIKDRSDSKLIDQASTSASFVLAPSHKSTTKLNNERGTNNG